MSLQKLYKEEKESKRKGKSKLIPPYEDPVWPQAEEFSTSLSTSLLQEAAGNEVSSQPPLLEISQTQIPQPLLTGHVFQHFHQLGCPSLDAFKCLNIVFILDLELKFRL